MNIRELETTDYELGYLNVLSDLTKVGTISKTEWLNQYRIISYNILFASQVYKG